MSIVLDKKLGKNQIQVISKRFFVKKRQPDGSEITIPVRRNSIKISDGKHDIVFGVTKRKYKNEYGEGVCKTFTDSRFNVKREVEVNLWGRTEIRGYEGGRKRSLTCKQMVSELTRLLGNEKVARLLVTKL